MAKTKAKTLVLEIPKIKLGKMRITLIGDSPLVVHAWSDKAKKMMLDKQMKKAVAKKEAKDPWQDYCESLYWMSTKPAKPTERDIKKAKFGFPAIAFKRAAVDACSQVDNLTKVDARATMHVEGDMIEIKGEPNMREDMVRIGMGTADIRYRAEFREWKATLDITYNASVLTPEQIINLFNTGGFGVGIGEHRPQKNGSWGRFHVEEKAA